MHKKLFLILSFFIATFGLSVSSFAKTSEHLCKNPEYYQLSSDEVNVSNSEFYCWEIKYLKKYQNRLSMDLNSYIALFPQPLFVKDVNVLREAGITPEKAEYLSRYFVDTPLPNKPDDKILNKALKRAEKELRYVIPYTVGTPISNLSDVNILMCPYRLPTLTIFNPIFKYIAIADCISGDIKQYLKDTYPPALAPIGVLGTSVINMFGEVIGEIRDKDSSVTTILNKGNHPIYVYGTDINVATWNASACHVSNLPYDFKASKSCISCHIFEITFNTISRLGYVFYDKLSSYAIDLMVVLFVFWMLFVFFDTVIKKQDGMEFVKTFFNKSMWVFIIGVALSISITSEHNILNYTIRPLTDFMVGYNEVLTRNIEDTKTPFKCKYKTKDISDSKVIFSRDIRENVVCTIERISAFNNMNYDIGKYNMKTGWHQFLNFEGGFAKSVIGIAIMSIFFFINIMVPFYFIEAFFLIAIVVFIFPLILVGYALNKKQFVKLSFDTFMSAIFQIVSLTLMCSVISILMLYISGLDFYSFQSAIENNNLEEVTAEVLYMISFTPNQLLEVFYTGFICWFLIGKAISIANSYKGLPERNIANNFLKWMKNVIKYTTTVVPQIVKLKFDTAATAYKIQNRMEKEKKALEKEMELAKDAKKNNNP